MSNIRRIFTVLLAVACAAGGGCGKHGLKIETTYQEHFVAEGRNVTPEQDKAAMAALHAWLPAHGYTQLHTPADIAAAMPWESGMSEDEVWKRPLDPAVPESEFVVTVAGERPELMIINLTVVRHGGDADHKRQIPIADKEGEEFLKAFDGLPWLKLTRPARH